MAYEKGGDRRRNGGRTGQPDSRRGSGSYGSYGERTDRKGDPRGWERKNREDEHRGGNREDSRGRTYTRDRYSVREKNDPALRGDRRSAARREGFGAGGSDDLKQNPVRSPETEVRTDYRDFEYRQSPIRGENREEVIQENILCGRNPIREALRSGRDIEKLLVQKGELSGSAREIVQTARDRKIMVQEADRSRLDEIAPHHQGLIAFAAAYQYSTVEDMLREAADREEAPFLIILDGVTDPHNLGAVIRTAECAGAHGVILPQHRSVGLTPAAVKASAGAIEHIKVAKVTNLNRTIDMLKKNGVWVYAVTMDGKDYEKVDFRGGTALVIGAEGEGISRLTAEKCDMAVSLPMKGQLDSLNASVAAGIVMYRVLSSRRKGSGG